MFSKVLIPIDTSQTSAQVARAALGLCAAVGAKAVLMHVAYEPPIHTVGDNDPNVYRKYARELLTPWLETASTLGTTAEITIGEGRDVANAIVQSAKQEGCDLIVMATHGREGLSKLVLGSVAERVTRLSEIPVLLHRLTDKSAHTSLPHRILVGIDGEKGSLHALKQAAQLAEKTQATLVLMHVVPDVPMPIGDMAAFAVTTQLEELMRSLEESGHRYLDAAAAQVGQLKTERVLTFARGEAIADLIVRIAQEERADLIAIGTHGKTGLDRLLLGSVAEAVVHHAPVPVLITRSPKGEAQP